MQLVEIIPSEAHGRKDEWMSTSAPLCAHEIHRASLHIIYSESKWVLAEFHSQLWQELERSSHIGE